MEPNPKLREKVGINHIYFENEPAYIFYKILDKDNKLVKVIDTNLGEMKVVINNETQIETDFTILSYQDDTAAVENNND